MKRNTITLFGIAALLASPVWGRTPLHSSVQYHSLDPLISVKDSSSTKTDQPIYNLYQLSQLLASDLENKNAIGYLNNIYKNSKTTERDFLKSKLYKHINYDNSNKYLDNLFFKLLYLETEEKFNDFEDYFCISKELKALEIANKQNYIEKYFEENNNLKDIFTKLKNYNESTKYSEKDILNFDKIKNIRNLNKFLVSYKKNVKNILDPINSKIDNLKYEDSIKYKSLKNISGLYLEDINILRNNLDILNSLKDSSLINIINLEPYRNTIYDQYAYFKSLDYLLTDLYSKKFSENFSQDKDSIINFLKFTYHNYDNVKAIRNNNFESLLEVSQTKEDKMRFYESEFKFLTNSQLESSSSNQIPLFTIQTVEPKGNQQSGFKMPSENDVIMGVAKFMANRAKQETMIWFIDKLRKDMRNSLIQESFPKTLALLEEQEDLVIPEFNATWQMALSEDFVKMPHNIINSQWVAHKVGASKDLNTLKSTVNISSHFFKLMNGKNDYRTILEQLYLQQQSLFGPAHELSDYSLYDSLTFLYILSNEFYQVDSSSGKPIAQLLTLSDFDRMTSTQWDIMMDLIRLKYGDKGYQSFKNIFDYNPIQDQNAEQNSPDFKLITAKFTSVLNGFKGLEKITSSNEFESKEKKAIALLDQVMILLKHIDPSYNEITNTFSERNFKQIQQFEQLLGVYKSIHQKEFGEVAKSTLNLIKPFVSEDAFQFELEGQELKLRNEKISRLIDLKNVSKATPEQIQDYITQNNEDYKFIIDKVNADNVNKSDKYKYKLIEKEVIKKIVGQNEGQKQQSKPLASIKLPIAVDSAEKYIITKNGENIKIELTSDPKTYLKKLEHKFEKAKKDLTKLIQETNLNMNHLKETEIKTLSEDIARSNTRLERIKKDFNNFNAFLKAQDTITTSNDSTKQNLVVKSETPQNIHQLLDKIKTAEILLDITPQENINLKSSSQNSTLRNDESSQKTDSKIVIESYTININEFKEQFKTLKQLRDLDWNDLNLTKGKESYQIADVFVRKAMNSSFIQHQFHFEEKGKEILTKDFIASLLPINHQDNAETLKLLKNLSYVIDLLDDPAHVVSNFFYDDIHSKDFKKNISMLNTTGQTLVKTSVFFTDILRSPDKDGVYRAIENAVAPPTSYLTKRKFAKTFTLNGYVGAYTGYQHARSAVSDYKSGFTYGVTAPIGFTYSTPKWGIFIQAVDLGNLVGHYIWETHQEYEKQKVSIKEVFSPGMNFLYNIPDSPFVLFTGMKMVQIPERFDEERGYINSSALDLMQITAGIKIDIPFFTIKKW